MKLNLATSVKVGLLKVCFCWLKKCGEAYRVSGISSGQSLFKVITTDTGRKTNTYKTTYIFCLFVCFKILPGRISELEVHEDPALMRRGLALFLETS